ncbi:SfnB family sulfur acquisition oxidoreductase [Mycobacterium sp. MAA66]|uniref:SfnB family sulfur acquisition oxidoreductase n=1 Tax=Mycobacterium sp. MAA66 TaxID=3156297 RepID=UPI0035195D88
MTAARQAARLTTPEQALQVAATLAEEFRAAAATRDAERILPRQQVAALKASGLLALSVPTTFGGLDAPAAAVAEFFRLLADADPSLAQIPQSHFTFLEAIRLQGTAAQKEFFFGLVRDGALLANAQVERGPQPVNVDRTTLVPAGTDFELTGRKFYCTGALFADWLAVRASFDPPAAPDNSTPKVIAFIPADTQGVRIIDDWDGLGQRTTASGTVTLDTVRVPAAQVVPYSPIFAEPTLYGARAQLVHTAIDTGIATGALAEGVRQTAKARPHFEADVQSSAQDPTLIAVAGELTVTVRAAQALLSEAARRVDAAASNLNADTAAEASVAVAVAKVAAARAALQAATTLFELGGTRSATASANLSRYWRDARTHTLHDATRWKLQHIGRYTLSGTKPPRHGQL